MDSNAVIYSITGCKKEEYFAVHSDKLCYTSHHQLPMRK